MSDVAAPSALQRRVQRALLGLIMAGLAIFPAAWLMARSTSARAVLSSWGEPATAPRLGAADARAVAEAVRSSLELLEEHRPGDALAPIEAGLHLDPGNHQLWTNRCIAQGLLGNRSQAVAACGRALALDPFVRRSVNNLAWVRSLPEQTQSEHGLASGG
jgi:Flp pilus assembly protein TadD